ncbi:MAG TPA: hypothetical protein VFP43_12905 [Mesorhizobium sp.]|nr:hypothetical protein [Mesorhizobium sp.]
MKAEYLYRGGILCLSLSVLAIGVPLIFFPEADDDWYFLGFMALCLGTTLVSYRPSQKPD